jgi:ABC-type transporter lipoprotein component MlaA
VQNTWADWGIRGVGLLNTDHKLQPTIRLIRQAFDPYTFARHAYLAQRRYMVQGMSQQQNDAEQELKQFQGGGK